MKAKAISILDSLFLTGTHWFWTEADFSQDESQDSPKLFVTKSLEIVESFKHVIVMPESIERQLRGNGELQYCGIELFFKWYFRNFNFNVQYCRII